jgi:4-hydroxysphinganine ceramide fatty acyl 2-hydroxylase
MKDFKIDNQGSATMFKNPILERLTRTHFATPVIFYLTLAAVILIYASIFTGINFLIIIALYICGAFSFSFVEYLIHRFIFHFNARTEKQQEIQYHMHGVHHEFPRDKDRLVMPPVLSALIAVLFFTVFMLTMGQYTYGFFPGFISGYSFYLLIHYVVHAKKPPSNFLKYWWKHHSLHHYQSVHAAFSVSLPLWDHVFGTMPMKKKNYKAAESEKLPDYITE